MAGLEEIEFLQRKWRARRISPEEIRRELRKLLFKHHPDRNSSNRQQAEESTRQILDWYHSIGSGHAPTQTATPQDSPAATIHVERREEVSDQFVLFMIEGELFGCDVRWVIGVRNLRDLAGRDGNLPRWIQDRQGIFPLDTSRRTMSSHSPVETAQVLLLKIGKASKGFVVDRVDGVVSPLGDRLGLDRGTRTFAYHGRSVTVVKPAFFSL